MPEQSSGSDSASDQEEPGSENPSWWSVRRGLQVGGTSFYSPDTRNDRYERLEERIDDTSTATQEPEDRESPASGRVP